MYTIELYRRVLSEIIDRRKFHGETSTRPTLSLAPRRYKFIYTSLGISKGVGVEHLSAIVDCDRDIRDWIREKS